jgi:hypothetical protein
VALWSTTASEYFSPFFRYVEFESAPARLTLTFLLVQHLLAIPSADLAGKQQWEAVEEAVHQIVTHSDDEYSLTYEVR